MKKSEIITRICMCALLIFLFIFPFSMKELNLFSDTTEIVLLHPFKYALENVFFLPLYFLPLFALYQIISLFIKEKYSKLSHILFFSGLTIYLIYFIASIIIHANTARWFTNLPIKIYITFIICLLLHCSLIFITLLQARKNDPNFSEYLKIANAEKMNKSLKVKISLKTKVSLAILGTVTIILSSFMFFILNSYKKNMTESVSEIGCAQAEQTASVYDSAEGLYDKILHFFEIQKESNSFTNSPYERIDIIITNNSQRIFMEKITDKTTLPNYDVFAYTTGKPSQINKDDKIILGEDALEIVKRFKDGSYKKAPVYSKEKNECKFFHPVTFGRIDGRKLVGFSVVTYRQEVLMKQYFHTKIFVITISLVFLYTCFLITFLISERIINPLLFLRANVRKTSNSINEVLSGTAKINQDDFDYYDCVKTNDEIKDLSVEIENLVSLIRGIVPYISFSTLQNADKDTKKSYSRELCFLFTDIRGFTSMCEGLPPKDVVNILNHYLDIETQIILDNGGDVDKFVGDEMMAFFAGPKKEYNACKAAMEIRAAMRIEQEKSRKNDSTLVSIGIGINTGKVVFGPIGSSTRLDFTSIGDTVNLAARLESANKIYGSKSIITEAVYTKLHETFLCRELDYITVKGKTEPVRIYEILQHKNIAEDKIYEIKELFEEGLKLYRQQLWTEANKKFTQNVKKYDDIPSKVFIERIKHFKKNPPPLNWDGVFVMNAK